MNPRSWVKLAARLTLTFIYYPRDMGIAAAGGGFLGLMLRWYGRRGEAVVDAASGEEGRRLLVGEGPVLG